MSKAPSPLLGYNNNVRHKNRVFHIQTEDSGVKHPHIITHLFMDGGRILKSVKMSYAEHIGNDKLGDLVRQMMKEQHKAMFIALRDGQFDHLVDGTRAPDAASKAAKAKDKDAAARVATIDGLAVPAPTIAEDTSALIVGSPFADEGPPTTREPVQRLSLDLEEGSAFLPQNDLPPPPANVLRERVVDPDTGRYKTVGEETRARRESEPPKSAGSPKSAPPKSVKPKRIVDARAEADEPKTAGGRAVKRSSRPPPKEASRYAPARPASIFGQAKPQQGTSIFGEDLISDKSLDEVILSYLAEDLEDEKK